MPVGVYRYDADDNAIPKAGVDLNFDRKGLNAIDRRRKNAG